MSRSTNKSRNELIQQLEAVQSMENKSAGTAETAERLRAILETAVEGIITIDERGLIESLNPAAERIFGYRDVEVIGKNVSVLMPSPYREEHDHYLGQYLKTGQAKIIGIGREVVGLRKDGSTFPMDLAVSEVRLADRRLFTGFIRDISDRKRAEARLAETARALAEKNKELETIVYVASHDLRSPLVNIQGFSQELTRACDRLRRLMSEEAGVEVGGDDATEIRTLLDQDLPEALAFIQAGVSRIDTLLSGFLRYSRLGRAALRIQRLNINDILAKVTAAMKFQIDEAAAEVTIAPLPDCLGDATQVNQVFANLLDNALKYLDPNRPGKISVRGSRQDNHCVYAIQDNGIGIAREHQGRIFEIFHRLNPHQGQGEGLGLAIAQRALERQNGKIWVESKPEEGSTFFVALPDAETNTLRGNSKSETRNPKQIQSSNSQGSKQDLGG